MLKYDSLEKLVREAEERGVRISQLVLEDQAQTMETTPDALYEEMKQRLMIMTESVQEGLKEDQCSKSGLTGGEGYKMMRYAQEKGGLCGTFMTRAVARAMATAGCNASMGRIVAAPTAGSCGILPGCLVSLLEDRSFPEKDIVMSMFTAGAFGMVIAERASIAGAQGGCQAECGSDADGPGAFGMVIAGRASIAGAQGGCQAECGSAAAMAAAALVEVMGGSPAQCADACAIAIANQLGLVCDPVAGLVEIPCIKRNVSGLVIAFSSADLALAGIAAIIPPDECLDAMHEVSESLPSSLKETAKGGLAATPTGQKLQKQVFGDKSDDL